MRFFKETQFNKTSGFPGRWEIAELKDMCVQRNEIVLPSGSSEERFVGLEHISSGETILHKYDSSAKVKSSKFKFYLGDILYGKLRPYLDKAVIANFDGICSTDLLVFSPKIEKVVTDFLIYVIHSANFIRHAISTTSGTNHPRTSWEMLSKFRLRLPSVPEQKCIAGVLSCVDLAIQKTCEVIAKTERLKKGLMQELLAKGIGHKEFKRSKELGYEIPMQWSVLALGDIADFKNGLNFSKNLKGGEGILTIDVLNMYGDSIYLNLSNLYRVNISVENAKEYFLERGDILFVRSSFKKEGVGWASLFKEWKEPVAFCGFTIRARLKHADVLPEFLVYFLRSDISRNKLVASSGQVAITNINQELLGIFRLPCPPFEEQEKITSILSTFDKKLELERRQKTKLERIKQSLMDLLLTGKVRIRMD